MTLKIRSRLPKPNQLFIMSQCYIHANLVKIWQSVHEISFKQESVMPTLSLTPTEFAQKTICPPPLSVGGHNYMLYCIKSNLVNLCGDSVFLFSCFTSDLELSAVLSTVVKRAFLLGVLTMLVLDRPTSDRRAGAVLKRSK